MNKMGREDGIVGLAVLDAGLPTVLLFMLHPDYADPQWWKSKVIDFQFNDSLFDILCLSLFRGVVMSLFWLYMRVTQKIPSNLILAPFFMLSLAYPVTKTILFEHEGSYWVAYLVFGVSLGLPIMDMLLFLFLEYQENKEKKDEKDVEKRPLLSIINSSTESDNTDTDDFVTPPSSPRLSFRDSSTQVQNLTQVQTILNVPSVKDQGLVPKESIAPPKSFESSEAPPLIEKNQLAQMIKTLRQTLGVKDIDSLRITVPASVHEGDSGLERNVYLQHPNLFSRIPSYSNELSRMVEVTRWYLSNFHSQASSDKKKPFNPIIGEQFFCEWKSGETNVKYVSEQVSHHPPISSYHMESKGIVSYGTIQPVVSFTGTALKLKYKGNQKVVINGNETYELIYPLFFLRGILIGRVFIDFVGESEIICNETGFKTKIMFHEKPWIGGEYRRITGQIFDGEGNSLYDLEGYWDKKIIIRGTGSTYEEVFFDAEREPVVNKTVAPVQNQGEMESQRLWQLVKEGIDKRDFKSADQAKSRIENLQRAYLKDNHNHQPYLFVKNSNGENVYNNLPQDPARKGWISQVNL